MVNPAIVKEHRLTMLIVPVQCKRHFPGMDGAIRVNLPRCHLVPFASAKVRKSW